MPALSGEHDGMSGWMQRLSEHRPKRVLLLLAAIWIVQGFDLGFTLFAHQCGTFAEMNPAAAWLLDRGPIWAVLFKVGLVLLGTVILWRYRTRAVSEGALWLVMGACVGLSLRWRDYFEYFADNAHMVQLIHVDEVSLHRPMPFEVGGYPDGARSRSVDDAARPLDRPPNRPPQRWTPPGPDSAAR